MHRTTLILGLTLLWTPCLRAAIDGLDGLPVADAASLAAAPDDWLITPPAQTAQARRSADGRSLVLANGLVRRAWRLVPDAATVALDELGTNRSLLRAVGPEARLTLDGRAYAVGGLTGQPDRAFLLPAWIDRLEADPNAFHLTAVHAGVPAARFPWQRRRHAAPDTAWPPRGAALRFDYTHHDWPGLRVSVHVELYDGVPAFCKWLSVHNGSDRPVTVDRFTAEELALVEGHSWVESRGGVLQSRPNSLHVETDFAFGGGVAANANRHIVHWRTDPAYTTQVNYRLQTPCLLVVEPERGPAQTVAPGSRFTSCRVFELVYDSTERERRGLALRRLYRTVAPWVTESPLTHHLLSHDPERVRAAIDEAASVGFEAIILSFGSGFNMENRDPAFLATWKAVADYAAQRGIELGSYSLFSSRGVGREHMIVSPPGQSCTHGQCPAVTSAWGQQWLRTIRGFYTATGFDQFENDGPYPGDIDVTARPPWQHGADDSRWVQWRLTTALYHDLRATGVFINAPDFYYLSGSNKCGMGYRETNWSLPRALQVIHTRQNIYDGTWQKTPSMGWMHVPLAQYHGGGAAATVEPLREHLAHYRLMLLSNLAFGVQAHYRGPRLFDAPETRDMVAAQVTWFKRYRDILESDLIHGRRADGRDLDWMLHVNPRLKHRGLLVVFNPLDRPLFRTLTVDLHYTGLTERAALSHAGGPARVVALDRRDRVRIPVHVPAGDMTWFVFEAPAAATGR